MKRAYQIAPDEQRASWAVTLLVVAYLKDFQVEEVYKLASYLITPGSLASRSVAFNVSALEAADALFADERYRDALWIYRLVYPRDQLEKRSQRHLAELQEDLEDLKEAPWGKHRDVLRLQETVGELEEEIKSLDQIQNYGSELRSRVARAYMETRRYWEARALYLHLYETSEDKHQVEECLYLAFHCSTQLEPWDRAFELGLKYMKEYPGGEYYDTVSVTVGQMYAMLKDWPNVIKYLTTALEVSPEHESAAECMFLIGYGSFMLESFKDNRAVAAPDEPPSTPATNVPWKVRTGPAWRLCSTKLYEEALRVFEEFLRDFPDAVYVEDATFRRAVCEYGLSLYDDSEGHLTSFAAAYPESKLLGEAYMMLADIAGTRVQLADAVSRYGKALEHELNIELYNYCSFRCAEMLNDLNDFPNIIRHFQAYLDRDREGSNQPLATYWDRQVAVAVGQAPGSHAVPAERCTEVRCNPQGPRRRSHPRRVDQPQQEDHSRGGSGSLVVPPPIDRRRTEGGTTDSRSASGANLPLPPRHHRQGQGTHRHRFAQVRKPARGPDQRSRVHHRRSPQARRQRPRGGGCESRHHRVQRHRHVSGRPNAVGPDGVGQGRLRNGGDALEYRSGNVRQQRRSGGSTDHPGRYAAQAPQVRTSRRLLQTGPRRFVPGTARSGQERSSVAASVPACSANTRKPPHSTNEST